LLFSTKGILPRAAALRKIYGDIEAPAAIQDGSRKFIDENGGGPGVRLRKRQQTRGYVTAAWLTLRRELQIKANFVDKSSLGN